MRKNYLITTVLCLSLFSASGFSQQDMNSRKIAEKLLSTTGISHGVCSMLSCGDNGIALELLKQSSLFLHILETKEENVASARKALDIDGLYGTRVIVEPCPLKTLPYADNTVDIILMVFSSKNKTGHPIMKEIPISMDEILRAVRPKGKVFFLNIDIKDTINIKSAL